MIPALFTMWALGLPMGFLVGDVFAHKNNLDPSVTNMVRVGCALITPLGAIMAFVVLVQTEVTDHKQGDNDV